MVLLLILWCPKKDVTGLASIWVEEVGEAEVHEVGEAQIRSARRGAF